MGRWGVLILLLMGVVLAKDEALHAYLKGADVPLIGLMELNDSLTEELKSLVKAAASEVPARRARLRKLAAQSAAIEKQIDSRQAPASAKELKLTMTRANNRAGEVVAAMEKALERLEGSDQVGFKRSSEQALKSLEEQTRETENAADLYKKLAVKALMD